MNPSAPLKTALRGLVKLSMAPLRRGPHVTRYVMYRRLAGLLDGRPRSGRVLSISHSTSLCEYLGLDMSRAVEANYPDCSLLSLPYGDGQFDYVVSDQVLQHVEGDAGVAIDETLRVLRPGGWAIHTTCCVNRIIKAPGDYWRFTPDGLRWLCRKASRVVEAGGWGNPHFWWIDWLGLRYEGVPEARWHPLHWIATLNEPDWPVHTWIVAEK